MKKASAIVLAFVLLICCLFSPPVLPQETPAPAGPKEHSPAPRLDLGDPISAETLAAWGTEVLTQIRQDLLQMGGPLYADHGNPDGQRGGDFGKYAFIWPSSYLVRALASAAKVQPRTYARGLTSFTDALDAYWIVKDGLGGYAVLPNGGERYYDDNACMVLALLDAYEATKQEAYLLRAARAFDFVASGERKTPGGGIRQHEDNEGPAVVCATAPATLGALRLYQITRDRKYVRMADRWYAFLMSEKAGFRNPNDGLFHEQNQGNLAYLSAWVLQANLLLHARAGDKKYLEEAQRIARASIAFWILPNGSMKETGQWGGSDFCDALLALYKVDKDSRWLATVHNILRYLHDSGRDRNGRYGDLWHVDRSKQILAKFYLLHMATVARAYWNASTVSSPSPPNVSFRPQAVDVLESGRHGE